MVRQRIAAAALGMVVLAASPAVAAEPSAARTGPRPADGASVAGAPYEAEIAAAKATMMVTPEVALAHARRAGALSGAGDAGPAADLRRLTATWLEGEALERLEKPDLALTILDAAVEPVGRLARDTKLQGDVLKARGHAFRALGRVQPALADYQRAYEIFQRAKEPRSQALTLQAIASVYQQARDDAQALKYYAQSDETYSADSQLSLASHNNRGMVLKDLGRLPEAQAEFSKALAIARRLGSDNLRAQILANLANTEILAGRYADARSTVQRGLALGEHDGEAQSERPFLLGAAAKAAMATGDAPGAGQLLDRAFRGVDLTRTAMEFRDVHETAARVYEATGDRGKALAHLKAFKRLDDASRSLAASASAALTAAHFDFANQNLRIAQLKEGQLERDMSLARSQARLRTFIVLALAGAGIVLFLATLLGFLYMRWSRDRIRAARDQLAVVNTSLEKALNAKTEFLATTSHEIRTPLNGILGMTQVVLADPDIKGVLRNRLGLVQTAGETMKMLVDDLLDVAKTESGALTLEHKPFSLRQVVTQTRDFWSAKALSKGLDLRLDAEVPDRAVGDQVRLQQILFNLMSNAIKFTDQGDVELHAIHEDGWLTLRVSDTGVGIGSDDHLRIFEPFTQVDSGTSRRFGGTGLGLSVCRNIVDAMGGRIAVESRPGAGASFTVRIPLEVAVAPPASDRSAPSAGMDRMTVLVLDSNPLNRGVLKAALTAQVGSATCTGGLDEALAHLDAARVDAVLAEAAALGAESARDEALARLVAASAGAHVMVTCTEPESQALSASAARTGAVLLVKPVPVARVVAQLRSAWTARPVERSRAA